MGREGALSALIGWIVICLTTGVDVCVSSLTAGSRLTPPFPQIHLSLRAAELQLGHTLHVNPVNTLVPHLKRLNY